MKLPPPVSAALLRQDCGARKPSAWMFMRRSLPMFPASIMDLARVAVCRKR